MFISLKNSQYSLRELASLVRFARFNKKYPRGEGGCGGASVASVQKPVAGVQRFHGTTCKKFQIFAQTKKFLRMSIFYREIKMGSKAFATHLLMIKG